MRVDSHSSVSSLAAERRPADGRGARHAAGTRTGGPRCADSTPAPARRPTPSAPPSATHGPRELDDIRDHQGIEAFTAGLEGLAAAEALTFEPTLNLQGLWAGHTDPATPEDRDARRGARAARHPPRPRPATGGGRGRAPPPPRRPRVRRHRDRRSARASPPGGRRPTIPWSRRRRPSAEDVTGQPATYSVSMAGTVPDVPGLRRSTGCPSTTLGAARDDCRAHAPDENVRIGDLGAGDPDHGPLPRPVRAPARGAQGRLTTTRRQATRPPRDRRGSGPRRGRGAARRGTAAARRERTPRRSPGPRP